MGFDLHGVKPQINKELKDTSIYGMINSIEDWKERWEIQDNLNEDDQSKYWKEYEQYHNDNPGLYFRNNVWWWRPLWDFVCEHCDDILSLEDISAGSYNDGRKINKTKALKISKRLNELLDNGIVDKYKQDHDKQMLKLKESKNDDERFYANYPFDKDNVKHFALFCKESGGFKIC